MARDITPAPASSINAPTPIKGEAGLPVAGRLPPTAAAIEAGAVPLAVVVAVGVALGVVEALALAESLAAVLLGVLLAVLLADEVGQSAGMGESPSPLQRRSSPKS
jgi:hypothetical protein